VNLLDPASGRVIATVTTDGSGYYAFTGLKPGDYAVQFVKPDGYQMTLRNQGSDDSADSDADTATGRTAAVTLAAGEHNPTVDAGMYIPGVRPAGIGDYVWYDVNQNGVQDAGEPGIAGVTVKLIEPVSGNTIATVTTDGSGYYAFTGLKPGDYKIAFELPSGYLFAPQNQGTDDSADSDADPATGLTERITLSSGENDSAPDAGMYIPGVKPASLGDYVWYDANHNGIQDKDESGISGITVRLTDPASGNVIAAAVTDWSGYYAFTGLKPGDYAVEFVKPDGYQITLRNQGSDDSADSDADTVTGRTASVTLAAGEHNPTLDAGMYPDHLITIGDLVWLDTDGNGNPSSAEGLPGVELTLYDADGRIVAVTTTDENGNYRFSNLLPGTYRVQVNSNTLPQDAWPFAEIDRVPDSTARIANLSQDNLNIDFGYKLSGRPDLSNTAKSVTDINGGTLERGDILYYAVTIYNAGKETAGSVVYSDTLDSYLRLIPGSVKSTKGSATASVSDDGSGADAVRVNIGSVGPGESAVITYLAQLKEDTPDGRGLFNQGWVSASGLTPEPTDFTETAALNDFTVIGAVGGIVSDAGLLSAKTAADINGGSVEPGDLISYRISIANAGPDRAENVIFTDSAPIYTRLVPGTLTSSKGIVSEGEPLTVVIAALEPGETADIEFKAKIAENIPNNALIFNQAVMNADGGVQILSDDPAMPLSDEPTILAMKGAEPFIKAYMSALDYNGGAVNPGDILEYSVTVSNTGTEDISDIVFRNLPAGWLSLIAGSISNAFGTVVSGNAPGDREIVIALATLKPGETITFTFQVIVAKEIPDATVLPNQGRISAKGIPNILTDDPVTLTTNDPTVVVSLWEPGIYDPPNSYKTVSGGHPVIYWEMVWINDRNADAVLVHVEDPVPENVKYVEGSLKADYGDYWYDSLNNKVVWEGSIPGNGGQVKIWFHTTVSPDVHEVQNRASALWDQNGDGSWQDDSLAGLNPVYSDNPDSPDTGDATGWNDFAEKLSLGNMVWYDANRDGVYQPESESGITGVIVNLYRDTDHSGTYTPGDVRVATTTTIVNNGVSGYYRFDGLEPGDYIVQIDPANFAPGGLLYGYADSPGNADPDVDVFNDDNGYVMPGFGSVSKAITLTIGGEPLNDGDNNANTNLTLNFGFYPDMPEPGYLSLGSIVWYDTNRDGIYQPESESGIDGVTVRLYRDTDGSGDYTPGDVQIATITTYNRNGVSGYYRFDSLEPGDYIVQIDPANFAPGGLLYGYADSRGNADPDDDVFNDDNGYFRTGFGAVSKAVTLTTGGEPVNDGDYDANTNMTVNFGFYEGGPGLCGLTIGDKIWKDTDRNGCFAFLCESGISGVRVNLYRDSNNDNVFTPGTDEFVSATVTSGDKTSGIGYYRFEGLSEGSYIVQIAPENFEASGALNGYVSTFGNADPDEDASCTSDKGIPITGYGVVSQAVTLTCGEEPVNDWDQDPNTNMNVDFGFYAEKDTGDAVCTLGLGDMIWNDSNLDGIRQADESGIAGVKISLWRDNNSGDYTPGNDGFAAGAVSDSDGYYRFGNLCEGDYIVRIDPENFETGVLKYYFSSPGNSDPDNHIDNDDNGELMSGQGVVSKAFTLSLYSEPVTGNNTDTNVNLTVDFGFYEKVPVREECNLRVGNMVWNDADNDGIRQADESGIAGVKVNLWRDNNGSSDFTPGTDEYLSSLITGESGHYIFENLCKGDYIVQILPENFYEDGVLSGYISSPGGENDPDDDVDNDDNGLLISGHGVFSKALTLSHGTEPVNSDTNISLDFGFYKESVPTADCNLGILSRVWEDTDKDDLWQSESESGFEGLTVNLYRDTDGNSDYTEGADSFVAAFTTSADEKPGYYRIGGLCEGVYLVQIAPENFDNRLKGYLGINNKSVVLKTEDGEADFGFYSEQSETEIPSDEIPSEETPSDYPPMKPFRKAQ